LIETKNHVDALLQVQQQLEEPQHQTIKAVKVEVVSQVQQQQQQQQMKSRYNRTKIVDIYQMEEKRKQSVIDEIEGQIIKPDEINMSSKGALDQEQIYVDSVKKTDPFRGGTKFKLYTASEFIFPKNENELMKTIMFGAQTAKQ
jgi:hypothetical protein